MSEVNWRQALVVSSLVMAVLLVCGSIYLHIQHKNHLGRLHHVPGEFSYEPVASANATPRPNSSSEESSESPDASETEKVHSNSSESSEISESIESTYPPSTEESSNYEYDENKESEEDWQSTFRKLQHLIFNSKIQNNSSLEADTITSVDAPLPYPSAAEESDDNDFDYLDNDDTNEDMADDTDTNEYYNDVVPAPINDVCLQCICETTSECKPVTCGGEPCGHFRISRPYWTDAGKQRVHHDSDEKDASDGGYSECVNTASCAFRTIYFFMRYFARDCNRDNKIDCRDYVAMHILGPSGCMRSELDPISKSRMDKCFSDRGKIF